MSQTSLLFRQPKVAVGDNCALWEYVRGSHPREGEWREWMKRKTAGDEKFFKQAVRALLLYNLWQDRHGGNYFRTSRHQMVMIDFYSRASSEPERFAQSFNAENLAADMPQHVQALVRQIILEKGECSDDEFAAMMEAIVTELAAVLFDLSKKF